MQRPDIVTSFSVFDLFITTVLITRRRQRVCLRLDVEEDIPLLNTGGKITTYRKLAESVMKKLLLSFRILAIGPRVVLPGCFCIVVEQLVSEIKTKCPFLPKGVARRLVRAYGTETV